MKKSLLALTVLSAFAGAASAQTSVTVYGIVDAGLVFERGGAAGSVSKLGSGVQSGTRLGFKGSEDLGGGLSAKFQLETGIAADTGGFNQGGLAFGRQSWVGLAGNFGQVSLGRQYTPLFIALDSIDPFGTGLAGASNNLMSTAGTRMNNTVNYTTNNLSGFTGTAAYGFGEVAGDTAASRQIGLSGSYANGPAAAVLAYHNTNNATATGSTKNTLLGGTWNFGPVTGHLGFEWNKADSGSVDTVDSTDVLIGASVPVGAGSFLASYIRKNDKLAANSDANQVAVGYTYALSKRTNFYTSYARISNKNGAAYTVGNATEGGSGDKAFNVGLRHKF
jgi:predicted porin